MGNYLRYNKHGTTVGESASLPPDTVTELFHTPTTPLVEYNKYKPNRMEMLRKVTKRKKKSEKEVEKPSEIDLDMDLEEQKMPQPAMMEPEPIEITTVPKVPEVSVEMQDLRRIEKEEEAQALDTFRQRISTYRNSQARYSKTLRS